MMDEAIGRAVLNGGVQVGKSLDVLHGYPIVHPYLQCLVDRWHPDRQNSKVRRNRVVGRQRHVGIRV